VVRAIAPTSADTDARDAEAARVRWALEEGRRRGALALAVSRQNPVDPGQHHDLAPAIWVEMTPDMGGLESSLSFSPWSED
jgi:hypothetical protein